MQKPETHEYTHSQEIIYMIYDMQETFNRGSQNIFPPVFEGTIVQTGIS